METYEETALKKARKDHKIRVPGTFSFSPNIAKFQFKLNLKWISKRFLKGLKKVFLAI